jgi:hypothetical protein
VEQSSFAIHAGARGIQQDRSLVSSSDIACNGNAEAAAALGAFDPAVKSIEYPFPVFEWNASALADMGFDIRLCSSDPIR